MLQSMRDNSKGVVAGILVGLLVIVFALSGADALFTSRNQIPAAVTINGEEISEIEVARAIEQQRAQMRSRFGDAVPEDFLTDENLRAPAMERLINRTLLAQVVRDNKMTIAPQRIDNLLISNPSFQDANGKFDPDIFRMLVARSAYTPASYRAELTRDMAISQLIRGITQSNFATDSEVLYVAELNNQLRSFDYLTLEADALLADITPDEQEVVEYYEGHTADFSVPEKVAVEYIELSVDKLQESIDIPEDVIRRQYEENIDRYTKAVERHVAHILLEDPADELIEEVQSAINAGEDFSSLAEKYSDDLGSKDMGGDLGITTEGVFPEAFEEALAKLSAGEVSGPVKTDSGVHFIKLLSVTGGEPVPYDEQKEVIAAQLKRAKAEERFIELSAELEDLSYNAESLADVADELGLKLQTSELFSRDGGAGIASSGAVVKAAFDEEVLEYGNASELLELAPDRVVVIKKIDYQASYIQPLDDVREQIVSQLKQDKAMALLAEQGQSIVEQLRSGVSIESVAEEAGLQVKSATSIQRSDMEQPRRVVEFAFSLPSPEGDEPVVAGKSVAGEYMVVKVNEVDVPEGELSAEQKSAMRQALASMLGGADLESFTVNLRETAEIE